MDVSNFWSTNARLAQERRNGFVYDFMEERRDGKKRSREDPNYDASTLYVPDRSLHNMNAMERQFWEIKKEHLDTVIFFKKGKFYELYDVDAELGQREFGLKMISDTRGGRLKMAGVPEQSFCTWAQQFVMRGYRVGRVEQLTKKDTDVCVPRELVKIYTCSTLTDTEMIQTAEASHLVSVYERCTGHNEVEIGFCAFEISCGVGSFAVFSGPESYEHFATVLRHFAPREIVVGRKRSSTLTQLLISVSASSRLYEMSNEISDVVFHTNYCVNQIQELNRRTSDVLGVLLSQPTPILYAFGGIVHYLEKLMIISEVITPQFTLSYFFLDEAVSTQAPHMVLDASTLEHLEILQSGQCCSDSLLSRIDFTSTPPGKRQLRKWVLEPLRDATLIQSRQVFVQFLMHYGAQSVRQLLSTTTDLERNSVRLRNMVEEKEVSWVDSSAQGKRTLQLLSQTMSCVLSQDKALRDLLSHTPDCAMKSTLQGNLTPTLSEDILCFRNGFDENAALQTGFAIPTPGTCEPYDALESRRTQLVASLDPYLEAARGYFHDPSLSFVDAGKEWFLIEVPTRSVVDTLPPDFLMFSTTAKVTRYKHKRLEPIVRALKEISEQRALVLQRHLKELLRMYSSSFYVSVTKLSQAIAIVDALTSLAMASSQPGMCSPNVISGESAAQISATALFHSGTKLNEGQEEVTKNDVRMDAASGRVIVLTGPNMGGKSTLMRAVGVATVLAQIGCFVHASSFRLAPVDRIYTRMGARDSLFEHKSTFLVELTEMGHILRHATPRSLVLVDELGRGTSTFDGYAVAWGALSYLVRHSQPLGFFSTHYYFLAIQAVLSFSQYDIRAMHMRHQIDPVSQQVILLHKLATGICSNSYGLDVAARAGLPRVVVQNAKKHAECLASQFALGTQVLHRSTYHMLKDLLCTTTKNGRLTTDD